MLINVKTFRTWEFLVLALTNVAAWLATASDTVNPKQAVVYSALSAGAYALARGFAKFNKDTKDFWNTTEFYVTLIGAGTAVVGSLEGTLSDSTFRQVMAALAGMAMIANGLRKDPVLAAQPADPPTEYPSDYPPAS